MLRERTPVALYERALEGAGGGVRRAVGRYQAVYRTEQTPVLSEIVPYCFSWLARTPGSAVPAPNLTTLPSGQLAFGEIQAEGLTTTLRKEGQQITLLAPGFTSPERSTLEYTSIALRPLSPMFLAAPAPAASGPRTPVTDDWFHRFGIPESPALRWRHLHRRLAYDVTPEDARYVAAAEELDSLIKTAVTATLTFPHTLEDVRFATGQALINLEPVAEEQADLIVGFDGIQAYRYTVRFPSGVLFDSVQYWHILSEEHGFTRLYSYADYAAQVGRPFATLGAWKLVPVEEASLPGL